MLDSFQEQLRELNLKYHKDHNIASGGSHFEKFREVRFESHRHYRAYKHHSTMEQLPDLKHLNLKRNKLERLPREGYNLTLLETLDLRNTGITKLPNQL